MCSRRWSRNDHQAIRVKSLSIRVVPAGPVSSPSPGLLLTLTWRSVADELLGRGCPSSSPFATPFPHRLACPPGRVARARALEGLLFRPEQYLAAPSTR